MAVLVCRSRCSYRRRSPPQTNRGASAALRRHSPSVHSGSRARPTLHCGEHGPRRLSELILRSRGIDSVIVSGIATNVCAPKVGPLRAAAPPPAYLSAEPARTANAVERRAWIDPEVLSNRRARFAPLLEQKLWER